VVLGYAWSMVVSASGWWTFRPDTLLGWNLLPHLPVEEALFYPLGGALCLLFYVGWTRWRVPPAEPKPLALGSGLVVLTTAAAAAVLLGFLLLRRQPAYLASQIVLYNGLCFLLWPKTRDRILFGPALATVGLMLAIGFFWDWLAFTRGWWEYHAVLGWYWPPRVPVDDWNFYFSAPLAAISCYEAFRRHGANT